MRTSNGPEGLPPDRDGAIELRDVSVVRGGRALLDGVGLTVRRGEYWALLGPNGAGKSTRLAVCGARMHPSRGAPGSSASGSGGWRSPGCTP